MRPFGFKRIGLAGAALITLFVAPSAKASPMFTTVNVDLGTIEIGINVNASIFNATYASLPQTYTYNQLLQNPANATDGIILDNGKTIDEELTALGYSQNTGVLNYNFPFVDGASGSYSQNGSPPYPPLLLQATTVSLTATSVSGTMCTGYNNVGATITVPPVDGANTYSTILGCDTFMNLNNGFPTSSTSTVTINLGTVTDNSTDTVTNITGEVATTTWESSGEVDSIPASPTPEPSPAWLVTAGTAAIAVWKRCRRLPN